jgi:hypothetical protein
MFEQPTSAPLPPEWPELQEVVEACAKCGWNSGQLRLGEARVAFREHECAATPTRTPRARGNRSSSRL